MLVDLASAEFDNQAAAAWTTAMHDALERGYPVFYRDPETGLQVMQQPDGRCFEIAWIPGAPSGRNYEILREMVSKAA